MSDQDAKAKSIKKFLDEGEDIAEEETDADLKPIDDGGEMFCPPEFVDLDMKKIKYCNLELMTNMNRKTIADILNVSVSTLSNWDDEPEVDRFKRSIKKQFSQNQMEMLKRQNAYFQQQAFAEGMDRWREPDPENDLPDDATVEDRERYMQRFFQNMNAKDFAKLWKIITKQVRLDSPDGATERIEGGVDVQEVRKKRSKVEKKRKKYREKKKKLDDDEKNKTQSQEDDVVDVEVEDEDGEEVEAQLVEDEDDEEEIVEEEEVEEISVEEYKIR